MSHRSTAATPSLLAALALLAAATAAPAPDVLGGVFNTVGSGVGGVYGAVLPKDAVDSSIQSFSAGAGYPVDPDGSGSADENVLSAVLDPATGIVGTVYGAVFPGQIVESSIQSFANAAGYTQPAAPVQSPGPACGC